MRHRLFKACLNADFKFQLQRTARAAGSLLRTYRCGRPHWYAELLVASAIDGLIQPTNHPAFDVVSATYGRVQVKERVMGTDATQNRSNFGKYPHGDFDWAAIVLFRADYTVDGALLIRCPDVLSLVRAAGHVKWSDVQTHSGTLDFTTYQAFRVRGGPMTLYEQQLRNLRWGLDEASNYFEGAGVLRKSLDRITKKLEELGIDYAVCGGLALYAHGFARFTDDVGLLVTAEGLRHVHEALDGLGYLPPFAGSKNLCDSQSNVRIEFLVAGQFPGDGKPKQVAFPDPATVSVEIDGMKFLKLTTLVELKLASGISNAARLKDLADVLELIKIIKLPADFANQLASSVRPKYLELQAAAQHSED